MYPFPFRSTFPFPSTFLYRFITHTSSVTYLTKPSGDPHAVKSSWDVQGISDEELQRTHPMVALLRTMLPWVNVHANAGQTSPEDQPEIPRRLWGAALANFPALAEHLEARQLWVDREAMTDEEATVIGRAIASWLMQNL
jgi:hypothetical protein